MSCEEFIYKVSYYKTHKHLNSWKDEYFLNEEDTRYIYSENFNPELICKVFVVKVCNKSPSYKMAYHNSTEKPLPFFVLN
tara:strand:- start:475 stop:714 length:240 start_codon:yes stop_codon:yes gene_type:complete